MQIGGNTFVVSGGSSGLGAACVRALAGTGANVVIADLNQAAGEPLGASLGNRVRFVSCDVTDEASVQAAIHSAHQAFGSIHGAICCAGVASAEKIIGKAGPHALNSFGKVVQVNLIGTFNVLRLAAAAMSGNDLSPTG